MENISVGDKVQSLSKIINNGLGANVIGVDNEIAIVEYFVHIPGQNGHPFRTKADSNSVLKRTLIPAQSGQ
jgi:hypothetical protein